MVPMSDAYHQLLDATIQHLEELKASGVRFVSVSAEALTELGREERVVPTMKAPLPAARAPQRPLPKPLVPPSPPLRPDTPMSRSAPPSKSAPETRPRE